MALFRHFFILRFTAPSQCSTCVSFVDVVVRRHSREGREEGGRLQNHYVFMDARRESPLVATPSSPPEQTSGWNHKKLTDLRAGTVLERIYSLAETCLIGVMIIKRLTHNDLEGALGALVGSDPEDLPHAIPPLYACDDMEGLVAEMPVLDEWALDESHKGSSVAVLSTAGEDSKQD
ncbi:hypothetical protein D1007_49024 [Hordeum vulgare]|nr:hypothetical protein D1007_49024 [Hordeum vulgare]